VVASLGLGGGNDAAEINNCRAFRQQRSLPEQLHSTYEG
jgi:hypothetical protein